MTYTRESQQDTYQTTRLRSAVAHQFSRRQLIGLGSATIGAGLLSGCASSDAADTNPARVNFTPSLDPTGTIEQQEVTIGFVPITCSSPIINAAALGIFEQYGLNVTLQRYAGWGELWIAFVAGEIDATQMLMPMPLAIHHNYAAGQRDCRLPLMTNINGQAITLGMQHHGSVTGPEDMSGLILAVPFDYSGHNLLLRDYLSTGGLDPEQDVEIRVMRPPDMVAALNIGDIDGFLGPDPFNQRAVDIGAGYLHILSEDLWDGHPCCSFAVAEDFAAANPASYTRLLEAISDSAMWTNDSEHRSAAAETMAGAAYLSQDPAVLEEILTGTFRNGLGETLHSPNRIGFRPYPHESYAIWALTQLQRWGLAPLAGFESAQDYRREVGQVLDVESVLPILRRLDVDTEPRLEETIIGRVFDPQEPLPWTQKQVNV